MTTTIKIDFVPLDGITTADITKKVAQYFTEWTAEGGLTDALNPAMHNAINCEAYLTGSGPNYLKFSCVQVPGLLRPRKV